MQKGLNFTSQSRCWAVEEGAIFDPKEFRTEKEDTDKTMEPESH